MSVEAFSVGFEKTNFHAPINSRLDREAVLQERESEIVDNLSSYIGEYRLGVKFDEYFYNIGHNPETGERFLMSKEQRPIREVYRNAIFEREKQGFSTKREVAECLGFEKLERELLESEEGTMIVWVSPPGRKEDGYGNYSFTFIGQLEGTGEDKRVRMIPYRNEATLEEHNDHLTIISGRNINFTKDTEFLSSPLVVQKREGLENPSDILKLMGEKEAFNNSWREEFYLENKFMFDHFMYLVKSNASDQELLKTRNAIEFLAIDYKKRKSQKYSIKTDSYIKDDFDEPIKWGEEGKILVADNEAFLMQKAERYVDRFGGYQLPKVNGSCGVGGNGMQGTSNAPSTPLEFQSSFGKIFSNEEDELGPLKFNCPEKSCGKENVRPRGKLIERCQHCRSTKVGCKD